MIMARNEDGTYSQVGFVKDNGGIDTEYIYDKDGDIVFEKGFTRETNGAVPLTINGIGKDLKAWSITGNTVQNGTPTPENPVEVQAVGDRTRNLFDKNTITAGNFATVSGTVANNAYYCSDFIPITATTYYFQNVVGGSYQNTVVVYDANKQGLRYAKLSGGNKVSGAIAFQSGDAYIRINCYYQTDVDTVMVNIGSTALPYEPYGYKIPVVTSADGTEPITTPIYLPTPLYSGEVMRSDGTITRSDGTTETFTAPQIPTLNGTTVIDVDTAVKPTEMHVKYKSSK